MKDHEDVLAIVEELKKLYPEGPCPLQHPESYELLFFVHLTAQCTGKRVNMVTPTLFAHLPILEPLAQADPAEMEAYIHPTGFFQAKAQDIVTASRMLVRQYGGRVPDTIKELLKLPGMDHKTVNLILDDAYHTPGMVVTNTHCICITGRLGLTDGTKDPAKVKEQLRSILPSEKSNDFCHRTVLHGRAVCTTRKSDCPSCTLRPWCDFCTRS